MFTEQTRGMAHSCPCVLLTRTSTAAPLQLPDCCVMLTRNVSCLTKGVMGICSLLMTARMTSSALPCINSAAFLSLGVFCRFTIASLPPARAGRCEIFACITKRQMVMC